MRTMRATLPRSCDSSLNPADAAGNAIKFTPGELDIYGLTR